MSYENKYGIRCKCKHCATLFLLPTRTWKDELKATLFQSGVRALTITCDMQAHQLKTLCFHPLSYLPGGETGGAHEMTTGLDLHIFVILRTDFTELESGAHLTVQLILLLRAGTKKKT